MRDKNCRQSHFGSRGALEVCAAGIETATLSEQTVANSLLDARTQHAMVEAINDEYHARAFYEAAIAKFGEIRPFTNIVRSEERHIQRWTQLFARYGLPLPEDTFTGNIEVPDTLQATCQKAVEDEIANVQMYDRFLGFVKEPDLRATFTQLRYVSQNNHKPAFERRLKRSSFPNEFDSPEYGGGHRGGHGRGHGRGRGNRMHD